MIYKCKYCGRQFREEDYPEAMFPDLKARMSCERHENICDIERQVKYIYWWETHIEG